jgi:D-xylulose reductase
MRALVPERQRELSLCDIELPDEVGPNDVKVKLHTPKELRVESVFRYAHQYDRAIALIASGKVDLKPLITETFPFEKSIAAFERAAEGRPADVKLQILVDGQA